MSPFARRPLKLRTRRVRLGEAVLISHYTPDSELIVSRVPLLVVNTEGLKYAAPTGPGSMGAPVVAVADRSVLGIHVGGSGNLQQAILVPWFDPKRVLTKAR